MKFMAVAGWVLVATVVSSTTACKKKNQDAPAGGSGATAQPTTGSAATPPPATGGARKVVQIAAGDGAACAVMDNGSVRCWGRNSSGERGTARSDDDAATPVEVPGVTGAVEIVMGGDGGSSGDVACVFDKQRKVWCWGAKSMIPLTGATGLPQEIPELAGVGSISLGGGTGFAVKPDGTVWGWGSPAFNVFADGATGGGSNRPLTAIPGIAGAKQVVSGQNHGCALLGDGTVTCWGYSRAKQLPTAVEGVAGATAIYVEAQREETCAATKDAMLCWGSQLKVRPVAELAGATKIVGRNHMCALAADGGVLCWGGENTFGMLGRSGSASTPGKVEGLTQKAIDVAVGHVFACAALADGSAACWGYNQRGQLGDGTLTDRATATPVVGISADKLAPARDGLEAVQEGPTATAWDGLPAACKTGALEIKAKSYEGSSFAVKAARATVSLGGKTIGIDLADHNFHTSWGNPRGKQGRIGLRLARFEFAGDKRTAVAVDTGTYKLGTKEERVVSPTLETKLGSSNLISISLGGVDVGTVTIAHLDDAWVCGELALATETSSIKGSFAAPIVK